MIPVEGYNLTFEEKTHTYKLNGLIIPSVTQILDNLGFYEDLNKIDPDTLNSSAKFGTNVHKTIELYNEGTLDFDSLDPNLEKYLDQYILFKKKYDMRVHESELRGSHINLGYAFTIDEVVTINKGKYKGKKAIVDIKTGYENKATKIQLAGYQLGYNRSVAKNPEDKVRVRIALHLKEDRFFDRVYTSNDDNNIFMSCLSVYNYKNNKRT